MMYVEKSPSRVSLTHNRVHTSKSCRVCGILMEALHRPEAVQTNSMGQTRVIPACTIVTCKNPTCQLSSFSFEAKTYHAEDLARYGVRLPARSS